MGIFDFVKGAGEKLGIIKDKDEEARIAAQNEVAVEQMKSHALWSKVRSIGLEVEDLKVEFDDGVATVRGTCPTQAEREKVILTIGNTEGVAKVDDRIEVVAPEPEASFYTVVGGDSLSKIALTYYGDAMKYPVIFEANQPMLTDPDLIYPGQVLRIPAMAE